MISPTGNDKLNEILPVGDISIDWTSDMIKSLANKKIK